MPMFWLKLKMLLRNYEAINKNPISSMWDFIELL